VYVMEIGELDVQTVGERERHIHNVDHINIYACLIVIPPLQLEFQ
jgi:hypothetical protein